MSTNRLVWVDIETTGLDVKKDVILEFGVKITDLQLNGLASFSCLIWDDSDHYDKAVENMDPYVRNMHTENNLLVQAKQAGLPLNHALLDLYSWLQEHNLEQSEPMCGSSVQFDRGMTAEYFPTIEAMFSYRNIDISTIKELCKRYNPEMYSNLDVDAPKQGLHRVMPDLDDTIAEFTWYRDNFLWTGDIA